MLDVIEACLVCTCRDNCARRFTRSDDVTMYCPDFTRDVTLNKSPNVKTNIKESNVTP